MNRNANSGIRGNCCVAGDEARFEQDVKATSGQGCPAIDLVRQSEEPSRAKPRHAGEGRAFLRERDSAGPDKQFCLKSQIVILEVEVSLDQLSLFIKFTTSFKIISRSFGLLSATSKVSATSALSAMRLAPFSL